MEWCGLAVYSWVWVTWCSLIWSHTTFGTSHGPHLLTIRSSFTKVWGLKIYWVYFLMKLSKSTINIYLPLKLLSCPSFNLEFSHSTAHTFLSHLLLLTTVLPPRQTPSPLPPPSTTIAASAATFISCNKITCPV